MTAQSKKTVQVNGESLTFDSKTSLLFVLEQFTQTLDMDLEHCVVAVNQSLVHRQEYSTHEIYDGDQVDILTAVVGG